MFIVISALGDNLHEAEVIAKDIPTFEEARKVMEDDMTKTLDEVWDGQEHDGDHDEFVTNNKHTYIDGGFLFDGVNDNLPEWRIFEV